MRQHTATLVDLTRWGAGRYKHKKIETWLEKYRNNVFATGEKKNEKNRNK